MDQQANLHSDLGHAKLDDALASLRAAVDLSAAPSGERSLDQGFVNLHRELELILREHDGMAGELLRVYEQLGIVFEITRNLTSVTSEEEVIRLFVDSLTVTYHDSQVFVVHRGAGSEHDWSEVAPTMRPCLEAPVSESIDSGQVVVATVGDGSGPICEVLSAPVFAGEEFVCNIVFAHDKQARPFEASDMNLVEALVHFCGDLVRSYHLTAELRQMSMDMVRALVEAIDQKDNYTCGHSNRVGEYACLLGRELGLEAGDLQMLEWAALLHDVGKIGIRDDVLNKPGKLTFEEFEHIKEHPVRSYDVVRRVPQLEKALDGVRHHHEKYGGGGYPDGLVGEEIPLQARIVQVADVFDALTTSRSYRAAFTCEKSLRILDEEAGSVCDPRLVRVFTALILREAKRGTISFEQPSEGEPATVGAGQKEDAS